MKKRAVELLSDGTVSKVIGWMPGEFSYDMTPAVFTTADEIESNFVYNDFCGANVSKYVMKEQKKADAKILVFLKPCDT
ncbi:MAG: 4Fe-4S ferredoxin, partial [Clostridia bacterium]|nr:4Fe-4S ferredoxin [Clostridia bacterium]